MKLSDLRISFIVGTLGFGGAERQLFYIIKTLIEQNAKVQILLLTNDEYWESRIKDLGVSIAYVGQSNSRLNRIIKIVQQIRKFKPRIIQSSHFYTNIYAFVAAKFTNAKDIGAIRSDLVREFHESQPLLKRLSLRLPRFIIANSKHAIKNAVLFGRKAERMFLLNNVVDDLLFRPQKYSTNLVPKLLAIGRLYPVKRYDKMLEIFKIIEQHGIQFQAKIVGDGPEKVAMQNLINKHQLDQNVQISPFCEEISSVYTESDILILTSEHEGMPNVILEAMASALPVVATNVGGVSEIIENRTQGFVYDFGRNEDMARGVIQLIQNQEIREKIGYNARQRVENFFALRTLNKQLHAIYRKVLT